MFYEGKIQSSDSTRNNLPPFMQNSPWPQENWPIVFWHHNFNESFSYHGKSFINIGEADLVYRAYSQLIDSGISRN